MMMKRLTRFIPHMLVIVIGILWFLHYDRQARKAIDKVNYEFVLLKKKDFAKGKIVDLYCPREVNCASPPIFLILKDSSKISVNASHDLTLSTTLRKTVSIGDSIIKKLGSDTVFIKKKDQVFKFLILAGH